MIKDNKIKIKFLRNIKLSKLKIKISVTNPNP